MSEFIFLSGVRSSIVLELRANGLPVWQHWGAKISDRQSLPGGTDWNETPHFGLDDPSPLTVMPCSGNGWLGPESFRAHRSGTEWSHDFRDCHVSASATQILINAYSPSTKVRCSIEINVFEETDVFSFQTHITNEGDRALTLERCASASIPLPVHADYVVAIAGRYANEFSRSSTKIGREGWVSENRMGVTSHHTSPVLSVVSDQTTDHSGEVWCAQLSWSGNRKHTIEQLEDGRRLWMIEEVFAPGELELAPGETYTSNVCLLSHSKSGLNGIARNLHRYFRRTAPVRNGTKINPVHLNTWEGCYFDHREPALFSLAEQASALGVERFVLDDGWFLGRENDQTSLGDWRPDPTKYPLGLAPLIDHVHGLGMSFGLWVEPEMVSPESELYKAHPDWVLSVPGIEPSLSRNQLVLDLSRTEVFTLVLDQLRRLLTDHKIDYLKWDHNRPLTQVGGEQGRPAQRKQVLSVYRLLDTLRQEHPDVAIESCAGGGGRIDAGILSRTDRFWLSDNMDALSRIEMHQAFLSCFPPERMGAHLGAAPSHSTGRQQSLDFRCAVATSGHFGLELDAKDLSDADRKTIGRWIELYKTIRIDVAKADVWTGNANPVSWIGYQSDDRTILFLYWTEQNALSHLPPLPLPFCAVGNEYSIKRIDPIGSLRSASKASRNPLLDRRSVRIGGEWLRHVGLSLPNLLPEQAMVLELKESS